MAHTYMHFDFGADEEKAQQARHKLEGWKQAFRLDKKLQVKFDRGEEAVTEAAESSGETEKKRSRSPRPKRSPSPKRGSKPPGEASAQKGDVKLLVRLYFSAHEKLSEQRSVDRILADDLFKEASPKVVHEGEPDFAGMLKQFDALE